MYIKAVNDDEKHEFSGLWASQILILARQWTSWAHKLQNTLQF